MATNNRSAKAPLTATTSHLLPGHLWQVPTFILGVLAILGVWASRPFWYDADARLVEHTLLEARRTLEDSSAPANELPALLAHALARMERMPARQAEAHYLLGWTYVRLAGPITAAQTAEFWRQAREHLELADNLGVAESDHTNLQYLLGKTWFQTGADPQRVIAYLAPSIDQAADDRAEGYAMLTQAYLRLPEPDLVGALQANQKQLDQPAADENRLAPARLLRGELLFRMQERQEARKVLSRIRPNALPAILSRARRLQARCFQEDQAWAEAAPLWEAILNDRREQPQEDVPQILYLLGWCYRNLHRAADASRAWERLLQLPGEEGQAAGLRLAELWLESGVRARALELLEQVLAQVTKPEEYRNGLVNITQARRILEAGCRSCQEAGDFSAAQRLAGLDARLVSRDAGELLFAQVSEAWAQSLRAQARKQKSPEATRRDEEAARLQFQKAARAYDAAGEAATDKTARIKWFWQAAVDYREGQAFTDAANVLERFLNLPPPQEKLSEAWYRLGEAHQALHNTALSVSSFKNCIGSPASPFAFRARYQLAMIALGEGLAADAEEKLRQNLDLMRREPDPEAHEKTLFAMADVLYHRGAYDLAAFHWEQALTLYPSNPSAATARYRLGSCYVHRAQDEIKPLRPEEASARQYVKQYHFWLEKAAANYQKLADDLEGRRAKERLSDADNAILAQALFAVAGCRFDLGSYDEAIRLYDSLANRYQHQVEGLIAARHLFWSYIATDVSQDPQHYKARASLERLQVLLNSLDDKAFAGRSKEESRPEWEKWIREAQQQLDKIGPKGP